MTTTSTKKLDITSWILTIVTLTLVVILGQYKIPLPEGVHFYFLPPIHALLNSIVAVCLIGAFISIKKKNILVHQRFVNTAMICSVLFLLCYVAYHGTTDEIKFKGQGSIRIVYFTLLISHILLSAISLPFILLTWIRGFTGNIQQHKKLARWVIYAWLYVAVTGPICYFLLKPYYP